MKKSLFLVAALFALAACTRSQEIDVPEANLSLFAKTESAADSRTVVEGGTHVYWEPGDEIMVFSGEKSAKFVSELTASSATATFKGTFGEETWPEDMDLWAVYPYSEEAVFDGETITTVLPSEQVARAGSFGKDMNLAIAHSTGTTLQFYNVGGGIRFSVTEEGIKKVIFEGLGGEIISGKVKIGFKNGLPVVQEVSNGSQFITLLPPNGSESFEKDTWYYIVAIPGSLESGYKLRFYKDSDYARKVSEKAVQIKRSIYGNIEKADKGIEYEAQMTHFPETKEEWIESDQIALDVSKGIGSILSSLGVDGDYSEITQEIVEQIQLLDNVKSVVVNEITNGFSIQLKDSSWINYVYELPGYNDIEGEYEEDLSNTDQVVQPNRILKASTSVLTPEKNKALVVAPYQSRGVDGDLTKGFISVDFNYIETQLNAIGYEMVPLKNKKFTISDLTGDKLSQYGLIIFATHGIYSYTSSGSQVYQTAIDTGVSYDDTDDLPQREQLARVALGSEGKNLHYYITDSWLEGTTTNLSENTFSNTIVCMSACLTYRLTDLADFFLQHGAGGYCGNYLELARQFNKPIVKSLVHSLCSGLSFPQAVDYVERDPIVTETFLHDWVINHVRPLSLHGDTKNDNTEVYLVNPYPKDLNAEVNNGYFELTWDQNSTSENYLYSYDVYFRDKKISTTYNKYYKGYTDIVGEHNWSIVANFTLHGELLASYRSEGEPFAIGELKPEVPQVETFPASVDEGNVFLSGNVINRSMEGLETGFFYYRLTEQEATMQLSYNDSLSLLYGSGRKVLSEGDYEEYFGVNLTDLEQNSTYLFAAYATDEYDQIGKGQIKSFKVGSPYIPVESVSLNKNEVELRVGFRTSLEAIVLPENATDKSVSWSSDNESVATVSSTGFVTGVTAGSAIITVTTSDGGYKATCNVTIIEFSPSVAVPETIDLGLPSGIKWASFNLGATKPEEYGDYYAWGETEPYYNSLDPLIWKEGKEAGYYWTTYKWCMGDSRALTKYCQGESSGYNGFTDYKTTLDPEDDAACVNLGGKWRMPTSEEQNELMDKCTWEFTQMNGINGQKVTGPNGNSIFIPAAGRRAGVYCHDSGSYSYLWSSSLYTGDTTKSQNAIALSCYDTYKVTWSAISRMYGLSVRPVSE